MERAAELQVTADELLPTIDDLIPVDPAELPSEGELWKQLKRSRQSQLHHGNASRE